MILNRNRILSVLALSAVAAIGAAQAQKVTPAEAEFRARVIHAAHLYNDGKSAEALDEFRKLNQENTHDVDVEAWLGFLYVVAKQGSAAVPFLEDASAQRPGDTDILNNLGNAYYQTGEYDKALDKYRAVSQANPTLFVAHYNSGNIYLKKQDYPHALVEYRKAADQQPGNASVQNDLGVAYERLRDDSNAAMSFQKASDLAPNDTAFARNAGLALYRTRQYDVAMPYLLKADQSDSSVALALGDIYTRQDKNADALKVYEAVQGLEDGNSAFWFNLGVIKSKVGDASGAESAYRKSLEIAPTDIDANTNLGLLLYDKGNFHEAEVVFEKLVGIEPNSITARMDLGSAAAKDHNYPTAIEAWRGVLRENTHDIDVRLSLAEVYYETGDFSSARYHFQNALAQKPGSARALNGMGLLYLHESKLAQAEAAFRGSIDADSRYVPAYNNLAVTLERMNRKPQAVALLEQALKLDPADANSRENLERLRAER